MAGPATAVATASTTPPGEASDAPRTPSRVEGCGAIAALLLVALLQALLHLEQLRKGVPQLHLLVRSLEHSVLRYLFHGSVRLRKHLLQLGEQLGLYTRLGA
jgi:hypothetical protein